MIGTYFALIHASRDENIILGVTMLNKISTGKVWLVGAGPGDPDLLTIKALRIIESADLILFDNLVSHEIRALFPKAVPAFYVGKVKDNHSIPQQELSSLLVKKARDGKNIVRIKGGDPFVFGRGAEELEVLVNAGIQAEVIPGITAASGCTTSANIPLTSRGYAQGCTFVTAHAEKALDVNWSALAELNHTLVFYMGVSKAGLIQEHLLNAGLDSSTPVALIENGCRDNQREVIGTLKHLQRLVSVERVKSPALIVVGRVIELAEKLKIQTAEFTEQNYIAHKCA